MRLSANWATLGLTTLKRRLVFENKNVETAWAQPDEWKPGDLETVVVNNHYEDELGRPRVRVRDRGGRCLLLEIRLLNVHPLKAKKKTAGKRTKKKA